MLLKIKQLHNIGRFAELRHRADDFKLLALLFARNATGKSTIAAVLRSAAAQQTAPIAERVHKGGAAGPASAELEMDPGGVVAFSGGQWKRTPPPILIFDQEFIRLNVHVAEEVTRENKRSMFRIILGPGGVALNQKLDDLKVEGDALVQRRQRAAAAIQRAEPSVTDVERFVKADVPADLDAKTRRAERTALRVEKGGEIGRTASLSATGISIDGTVYPELLRKTLADGGSDLEQELTRHIEKHRLDERGRQWLRYGLEHAADGDCAFCDQPLFKSPIFAAVEALLGPQYQALADELDGVRNELAPLVGDGAGSLQRVISQNALLLEFWGRVSELPPLPGFDNSTCEDICLALGEMLSACEVKQRQPNVAVIVTDQQRSEWSQALQHLRNYDEAVGRANQVIQGLKAGDNLPSGADVQIAKQNSQKFHALAKRDTEPLKSHVEEWKEADEAHRKVATERSDTQTALKNYMRETTAAYQTDVNELLERFGCNFRLCDTDTNFKGGGKPNADFCIDVDGYVVPAGESGAVPQPSFRTVLSGGDKSALALAFFIAQARRRTDLGNVTIVFDDPFASQDTGRQLETILRIRELAKLAKQVVVLSHDPRFLFSIWKDAVGLDVSEHQIGMVGEWRGEIRKWSCELELEEEYVRRAAKIRAFASNGQHLKGCTDGELACHIRPFLEEFIDRRFPGRFARLEMLDTMVKAIAENPDDPLHAHHVTLAELNEFSRPEHHRDPDRQDPAQLKAQCRKVMDIVGRY